MSNSLVVRVGADISSFQRELKKMNKEMYGVGNSLIGVGTSLSKKVTAPLMGMAAASVKSAMSFEASFSKVRTTVSATEDEFNMLSDTARHFGRYTEFSANQVASAMSTMGLATLDAKEIYAALPATIALATSANMDLATATASMTNVLGVFAKEGSYATYVADMMTQANKLTAVSIKDIEGTFLNAGSAINNFGISLADATKMTILMADGSLTGKKAGTQLRALFDDLAVSAVENADAFRALGIRVFDANGNMLPAMDIVNNLRSSLGDMSDTARIAAFESMELGVQAQAALSPMLAATSERLDELTKYLYDTSGAAEHYANIMRDNLKYELRVFWGNIRDVGITIGNVFLPAIRDLTTTATDLARTFAENLSPEMARNIVTIGGIAAAIGPLLVMGGKAVIMYANLKGALTLLSAQSTKATNSKIKLATAQSKATTATIKAAGANTKATASMTKAKAASIAKTTAIAKATKAYTANTTALNAMNIATVTGTKKKTGFTVAVNKANLATAKSTATATKASTALGAKGLTGVVAKASKALLGVKAAPLVVVGAAAAATGLAVYRAMNEDAIPAVDIFADRVEMMADGTRQVTQSISEDTQEIAGAFFDMKVDVERELITMMNQSFEITDEQIKGLKERTGVMTDNLLTEMERQRDEGLAILEDRLREEGELDETAIQERLQSRSDAWQTQIDEAKYRGEEMLGLIQRNLDSEQEWTADHTEFLRRLMEEHSEDMLRVATTDVGERELIMANFRLNQEYLTAESYGRLIQMSHEHAEELRGVTRVRAEREIADLMHHFRSGETITDEHLQAILRAHMYNFQGTEDEAMAYHQAMYTHLRNHQSQELGMTEEQMRKLQDEISREYQRQTEEIEGALNDRLDAYAEKFPEMTRYVDRETGKQLNQWQVFTNGIADWWDRNVGRMNGTRIQDQSVNHTITTTHREIIVPPTGPNSPGFGRNANGTANWGGGLTWINERGPELVTLPSGTKIIPHSMSKLVSQEYGRNLARAERNHTPIQINQTQMFNNKINTEDTREMIGLLRALVEKDSDVYLDSEPIGRMMDIQLGGFTRKANYLQGVST